MKIKLIFLLSLLMTLAACNKGDDSEGTSPSRTVLVYMMAENSLYRYANSDIEEMIQGSGKIPSNSHLIVYVDDDELPRIYEIKNGRKTLAKQFDVEQNSATAANLGDILRYTISNYRADSYALVLWSHATGWYPATSGAKQRTIGVDNGNNTASNNGSEIEIADLATTLKTFPKFDFIFSDACFMQCIEVGYALKDCAAYIIGSPAEIPADGAPYNTIMASMFAQPGADVNGIIQNYYEDYKESTGVLLSVILTDKLDALATATASVLPTMMSGKQDIDTDSIQHYSYFGVYSGYRPEFFDMNGVMYASLPNNSDYARWKFAFDMAVPYKAYTSKWYSVFNGYGDFTSILRDKSLYGGISMYVPGSKYESYGCNAAFRRTEWYTAAGWASTGW